jgi:hypothetical protein
VLSSISKRISTLRECLITSDQSSAEFLFLCAIRNLIKLDAFDSIENGVSVAISSECVWFDDGAQTLEKGNTGGGHHSGNFVGDVELLNAVAEDPILELCRMHCQASKSGSVHFLAGEMSMPSSSLKWHSRIVNTSHAVCLL